jgi:YidC/Oxa1 family membrane protein insertase
MFSTLYNEIIYRPLLNLLVFFYNVIPGHDVGIVIIVVTIIIRLLLAPSFHKSLKSQKAMNDLQPKLAELREKHKGDKEGEAKAMMALYSEHKINPFSSCLPLLLQLPILIGLYQVFKTALDGHQISGLYSFISVPEKISPYFLNFVNLHDPSWVFGVIAGLAQFWQSKMMMAKSSPSQDATARIMQAQTVYMLPLLSVFISLKLPAGLPLYWIVTTLFAIGQQYYIIRKQQPVQPAIVDAK